MSFRARPTLIALSALTLTSLASTVAAGDGALEIHQSCVATGCFPGDSPGWPVELSGAGSYRLTSNLQVPDQDTTAVAFDSDNVHLDLGGFTISGVTDCGTDPGDPCSPLGSGVGIDGSSVRDSTVAHGSIRGMGSNGINLGYSARVDAVHTSHNGRDGISLPFGGAVRNSSARRNGRYGFLFNDPVTLAGSIASRNGEDGIRDTGSSTLRGNVSNENGGYGLWIGAGSVALGNTLSNNVDAGLSGSQNAGFGHNSLFGNADGTSANQVAGTIPQVAPNLCVGAPCP